MARNSDSGAVSVNYGVIGPGKKTQQVQASGGTASTTSKSAASSRSGAKNPAAYYDMGGLMVAFDASGRHIPTEWVPSFTKGEGFDDSKLISSSQIGDYLSRNYGESNGAYEAYNSTASAGGGSSRSSARYDAEAEALRKAQEREEAALRDAFNTSVNALDEGVTEAQRQAYVNARKARQALPQVMAAAGYTGGITETTAAGIESDYQNALTDLQRQRAAELAKLQQNLSNRIATTTSQYELKITNALKQAQQLAEKQQAQAAQRLQQQQSAAAGQTTATTAKTAATGSGKTAVVRQEEDTRRIAPTDPTAHSDYVTGLSDTLGQYSDANAAMRYLNQMSRGLGEQELDSLIAQVLMGA